MKILYTHQLNKLGQSKSELNKNRLRVVAHRPYQSIIITEQVIVQPW